MEYEIITATPEEHHEISTFLSTQWCSPNIVFKNKMYHADQLPAFYVRDGSTMVALMTLTIEEDSCWIVTLDSLMEGKGIGSRLIETAKDYAHSNNCKYLRVITTNDNTGAFGFYQKRGFVVKEVHIDAVRESRRLKPEIPMTGVDRIPIRDEIELEMLL